MRKTLFLTLLITVTLPVFSQGYESYVQFKHKIIKGLADRSVLEKDTTFAWVINNRAGYQPDAAIVERFKANKDSVQFFVFFGTWCGDTRKLLPKFLALADAAGIPNESITLVGVDHYKKALGNLTTLFNVTRVPTFIVLKNGKELGRVVEYGTSGQFDKDLAELLPR